MPILPIRHYPDAILRKKTTSIQIITAQIQEIIQNMIETMYRSPNTIGLAAPQVGHALRLIVLDVTSKEKRHGLLVLLNPVLIKGEGKKVVREGCLSLPDYTGNVSRFEHITVQAQNREGKTLEIETDGIEGVCIQHEIDHINGMMFLDRVESLKTDIFRRKRYQSL